MTSKHKSFLDTELWPTSFYLFYFIFLGKTISFVYYIQWEKNLRLHQRPNFPIRNMYFFSFFAFLYSVVVARKTDLIIYNPYCLFRHRSMFNVIGIHATLSSTNAISNLYIFTTATTERHKHNKKETRMVELFALAYK